jgi:CheY-like chemotaxis protein
VATELYGIIREAEALLRASLPKTTRVDLALAEHALWIEADPLEVQQVAMNLIINASEALEAQRGVVRIHSGVRAFARDELRAGFGCEDPQAGTYAFLEVGDEGVGMDAETRARIFEPFYSTKLAGRGLGLSVVLRIVQHHDGLLMIDSEPGRGAQFRVLFPHLAETSGARVAPVSGVHPGVFYATVLVVDDEESVRKVARQILERAGSRVFDAPDGEAGLEALRRLGEEVDLVLLDLTLPGLQGTEVARAMERTRPGLGIVLMSGFSTEPTLPYRLPFLRKPFDAVSLVGTLRGSLRGAGRGDTSGARPHAGTGDVVLSARLLRGSPTSG